MTHNDDTGMVRAEPGSGLQKLSEIDFQELFKFETKTITLGQTEVWKLKGRIMLFGKGAQRVASMMGVELIVPETINIDGVEHSNPHIVWRDGVAKTIYIMKHGIRVAPDGIRYIHPVLDVIEISAVAGQMALNAYEKAIKTSKDAAKNCTRKRFNEMVAMTNKPGDPDWWFIPTLDDDTGIAFNLCEPGEAGKVIETFKDNYMKFKQYPLRKVQTGTDRRVIEMLIPEVLTSFKKGTDKINQYNQVESIEWEVPVPTQNHIARHMLIQLGLALRDNDPASRERAMNEVFSVLGGQIEIKKIAASHIQPGEIIDAEGEVHEIQPEQNIKPCPQKLKKSDFHKYWNTEFRKLNTDQKARMLEASGYTSWEEFEEKGVTRENKDQMIAVFHDIAGIAPPEPSTGPDLDSDKMRGLMLDWMMDNEGNTDLLDAIFKDQGLATDMEYTTIPDETIAIMYKKFQEQLKARA